MREFCKGVEPLNIMLIGINTIEESRLLSRSPGPPKPDFMGLSFSLEMWKKMRQ